MFQKVGAWELGVFAFMCLLYLVGAYINPGFFGDAGALAGTLRDAARYGVMAMGMSFVIINKDLDLSVGSTMGLSATIFSLLYAPGFFDFSATAAALVCLLTGLIIGTINGVLTTYLRVPAFIATLTMLLVGRGLVLGFSGGKNIGYAEKAGGDPFFLLGMNNPLGFNNQIIVFLVLATLGGIVLANTRWGYETYAVGGNLRAAELSGVPTQWVRIRAFILSSLMASLAGLMIVAQQMGADSLVGEGAELVVIASVIVGGASILGGRGTVLGSALGATLIVLIDKVLREGVPTIRIIDVGGEKMEVASVAQLPPGAVPAFLGVILVAAVLIEPWLIRRRVLARIIARLKKQPPPPVDVGTVAIESSVTHVVTPSESHLHQSLIKQFFSKRESAALLLALFLWMAGFYLRPDFWGNLDNSFNLLLAFTEVALMTIGMSYVIGNGDIDLSVGAVLALSGSTAAFLMKEMSFSPLVASGLAFMAGLMAGVVTGTLVTRARLPAFVASLGMFYIARGIAAWIVAGRQLNGFPAEFNLLGRKMIEVLKHWGFAPESGIWLNLTSVLSNQTLIMAVLAVIFGVILWRGSFGYMVKATGGNIRAAGFAGINTDAVRFKSLLLSAGLASLAGIIYVAFYRSYNPSAGQLRELDVIASVIIGGGSLFGGYASVLGALAGAAVITLVRAVLSLQVILDNGESFVMPQHWVNVSIGTILIFAVLTDIWIRQYGLLGQLKNVFRRVDEQARETGT
ncbi:MAG: ABC transporter permease [Deltaproteobacteria bacterium]|nr:ABC transporter permease [Deltaproteobacteria bacterium]